MPLPLTPVPGLSVNGIGASGPLLREATTGYYNTVNENVWRKYDNNRTWILYARQNIRVDERMTLHNQLWYRRGDRLHQHYNNFGLNSPANLYEHNNPFSHMYGDKIWSDIYLTYNQVGGRRLFHQYRVRFPQCVLQSGRLRGNARRHKPLRWEQRSERFHRLRVRNGSECQSSQRLLEHHGYCRFPAGCHLASALAHHHSRHPGGELPHGLLSVWRH